LPEAIKEPAIPEFRRSRSATSNVDLVVVCLKSRPRFCLVGRFCLVSAICRLNAGHHRHPDVGPALLTEDIMTMTRDDIISVLGPVDETVIADIASTGATIKELREAFAWTGADEALMNEGRPLPSPRVAVLIDLLDPLDDEDQLEDRAASK
jgi:hypothetical protein